MDLFIEKNNLKVNYEKILQHHDVVFNAPVCDVMYGIPLGNGDLGALLWLEKDALVINVNKTDLWDESLDKDDIIIPKGEENMTTCCSGATIRLKLNCPVFDGIYAESYQSRLSLSDATANIDAKTPFCSTSVKSFVARENDVVAVRAKIDQKEILPFSVEMERWGSRTLAYWYLRFEPDNYEKRLDGTNTYIKEGAMYISQKLNGTCFAVGLIPKCDISGKMQCIGTKKVQNVFNNTNEANIDFFITIGVADTIEKALAKAEENLKEASKAGFDGLFEVHKKEWSDFWTKSFVSLPEDLDYIENLWYLCLYYANSSMRGKYPAHFCDGIWNHYHDFVPWNHYFHYNMQHAIHPLGTANHSELAETYLNFRAKQLPLAIKYAEKYKKKKGAFYCDVCDKFGRNEDNTSKNCTAGSQIAMMLYRHALYTMDDEFLRNKVLPVMKATADYYLDVFKKEADGYYHIDDTQGYEGSPLFKDSITDHTMLRILFKTLGELLDEKEFAPYKEVLDNIAPYMTTKIYDEELADGKFVFGIGKGKEALGDDVLGVGISKEGKLFRNVFGDAKNDWYGFPDTEMAPVFPAGLVGIKDKNTAIYNMIYNSLCLHHAVDPGDEDTICMGWCMLTIYLARMGMGDLLEKALVDTASTWIKYPNGFGVYGPYKHTATGIGQFSRFAQNKPRNVNTNKRHLAYQWDFRHFDYETLPILATSVNEMLIQSYDGIVRLFCTVNNAKSYGFSLAAINGFMVDAVYNSGECNVIVKSKVGGELKLCLDNLKCKPKFYNEDGKELNPQIQGEVYIFETSKGQAIHITTGKTVKLTRQYSKNNDVKILKESQLGCPKEY